MTPQEVIGTKPIVDHNGDASCLGLADARQELDRRIVCS